MKALVLIPALVAILQLAGCSSKLPSPDTQVKAITPTAPLPKFQTAKNSYSDGHAQLSPSLSDSGTLSMNLSARQNLGQLQTEYYQRTKLKQDSDRGEIDQQYVLLSSDTGLSVQAGLFKKQSICEEEQDDLYAATRGLLKDSNVKNKDFYLYLPSYDAARKAKEQVALRQQYGGWRAEFGTGEVSLPKDHGGLQSTLTSHLAYQQGDWHVILGHERSQHSDAVNGSNLTVSYQSPLAQLTASANSLQNTTLSSQSLALMAQEGPWSLGYFYAQNHQQRKLDSLYASYSVPFFLDVRHLKMTMEIQHANGREQLDEKMDPTTRYKMKLDYKF